MSEIEIWLLRINFNTASFISTSFIIFQWIYNVI
jgi:hypothetical protein